MEDRDPVRGLLRRVAIEVVVEDGFDRAVGAGADVERPAGGGLEPRGAERLGQTDDAETGAEALLGARSSRIRPHSAAVAGPIVAASLRMRSMVQPA